MPTHLGQEIYPSKQFLQEVKEIIRDVGLTEEQQMLVMSNIEVALRTFEERINRNRYNG